uniref:Uncharacterized protein n=1 Tax=Anguilla anguilla TaxID=7936 RepID=A0A0E9QWK5_ANGAN
MFCKAINSTNHSILCCAVALVGPSSVCWRTSVAFWKLLALIRVQ